MATNIKICKLSVSNSKQSSREVSKSQMMRMGAKIITRLSLLQEMKCLSRKTHGRRRKNVPITKIRASMPCLLPLTQRLPKVTRRQRTPNKLKKYHKIKKQTLQSQNQRLSSPKSSMLSTKHNSKSTCAKRKKWPCLKQNLKALKIKIKKTELNASINY